MVNPTFNGSASPRLRTFALAVFLFTSLLLFSGGYTTTIGAGMIFPDWPLSNGSLNPDGWLTDEDMAAEHSHRLFGMVTGLLTLALAVWTWLAEPRKWVRRAATVMLALVIVQGVLGGLRVILVNTDLAIVHGCTAQLYLCALATMVFAHVPGLRLRNAGDSDTGSLRILTPVLTLLIFGQLIIAAAMRHQGAGLAIPTFPLSPSGSLFPDAWPAAVTIHFAHRAMALVITVVAAVWAWKFFRRVPRSEPSWRLGVTFCALLGVQVLLGALTIWTVRNPWVTTFHVLTGAYLLALSWGLTLAVGRLPLWSLRRAPALEASPA
ncbi:MAG: heme A synthase [Opitutales bacterium]